MDPAEVEEIKRQIAEQEIAMKELNKSWAQKLEEAMLQKSIMQSETDSDKLTKEKKMTHPYLSNVNEDPLLSGMILVCLLEIIYSILLNLVSMQLGDWQIQAMRKSSYLDLSKTYANF